MFFTKMVFCALCLFVLGLEYFKEEQKQKLSLTKELSFFKSCYHILLKYFIVTLIKWFNKVLFLGPSYDPFKPVSKSLLKLFKILLSKIRSWKLEEKIDKNSRIFNIWNYQIISEGSLENHKYLFFHFKKRDQKKYLIRFVWRVVWADLSNQKRHSAFVG